jgi:hypothetical protein
VLDGQRPLVMHPPNGPGLTRIITVGRRISSSFPYNRRTYRVQPTATTRSEHRNRSDEDNTALRHAEVTRCWRATQCAGGPTRALDDHRAEPTSCR